MSVLASLPAFLRHFSLWDWVAVVLVMLGGLYLGLCHWILIGLIPRKAAERPRETQYRKPCPVISHEFKNYVCTLKGNARLLRARAREAEETAIIERIERVVDKLEAFTREWAAAQDGLASGVCGPVLMDEATRSCVQTHFSQQASKFRWEGDADPPPVRGDASRLEQVFVNLYANALEAGAEHIVTAMERRADVLCVRVEDDGKGCTPEVAERIFEPFFTTKAGNRGLGTFIVRSIVMNHGGRIGAVSKNGSSNGGHGLVIHMEFPLLSMPISLGRAAA